MWILQLTRMHHYSRTQSNSTRRSGEQGQATVMISCGVVFIFGILGMVVDVGYGYFAKQTMQAAADSAAMAAAIAAEPSGGVCDGTTVLCQTNYTCPPSPTSTSNFGAGCLYAKQNGLSGQTVTMSSGNGTVGGANTSYWVTATATQQLPVLFSRVLGATTASASATATGGVISSGSGSGCIITLDPSAKAAFWVTGTASVTSSCGIYDDSNNSEALWSEGSSTTTAPSISVVGGTHIVGSSVITPSPTTGVSPMADPLASLPAPSYSGCDHTSFKLTGSASATLNPGVYCNGISITASVALTLNPGIYILNGGGLSLTGCCTTVTGSGVFFYNTSNGYSFGALTMTGGSSVNLSAPTSGTYKGILFYQDRTITSSATNTIVGGSSPTMSGTVYMPTAALNFEGSSTSGLTMALIADTVKITGSTKLNKDTTGALTGLPQSSITASLVQ